jgi:hypothetical protein
MNYPSQVIKYGSGDLGASLGLLKYGALNFSAPRQRCLLLVRFVIGVAMVIKLVR